MVAGRARSWQQRIARRKARAAEGSERRREPVGPAAESAGRGRRSARTRARFTSANDACALLWSREDAAARFHVRVRAITCAISQQPPRHTPHAPRHSGAVVPLPKQREARRRLCRASLLCTPQNYSAEAKQAYYTARKEKALRTPHATPPPATPRVVSLLQCFYATRHNASLTHRTRPFPVGGKSQAARRSRRGGGGRKTPFRFSRRSGRWTPPVEVFDLGTTELPPTKKLGFAWSR